MNLHVRPWLFLVLWVGGHHLPGPSACIPSGVGLPQNASEKSSHADRLLRIFWVPVAQSGDPAVTDRWAQLQEGGSCSTNKQVTLRQNTETECTDGQDLGHVGGERMSWEQKALFPA